jgi:hypothetical protein
MRDPYANPVDCKPGEGISVSQIEDKAAILNAKQFKGLNLAVSANGVQTLNLK